MKKLEDKETNLIWIEEELDKNNTPFNNENLKQYLDTINEWGNHPKVQKFLGKHIPLGDRFFNLCFDDKNYHLYFIFEENKFVSSIIISQTKNLLNESQLRELLTNEKLENSTHNITEEKFLTNDEITKLLDNKDSTNLYLVYNVVDPEFHNKGIGTRILKSIKNNLYFFANTNEANLQAIINTQNIGCVKMVCKQEFRRINPAKTFNNNLSVFYCHSVSKNNFNEIEKI